MAKPFKFRYVNEIVGAFVLLVIAALIAGVFLAAKSQQWFVPVHDLRINFPPEGSLGVQIGAEVQILGAAVGKVEKITVDDAGNMHGDIHIKGDFFRFVRADSVAKVRKKFGIAGDAYIEITKGTGTPLPDDATMDLAKDIELTDMAQDALDQVKKAVLPALEQLKKAVEEYTALAADFRNPEGPLLKMLANVEEITAGLKKGEGSAGKLLRDPAIADEVERILKSVNDSLGQVRAILDDVKATTARMPAIAQKVGAETEDLPGLVAQTQESLREAERLIEGVQQHWLIRKYISRPEPTVLIAPSQISELGVSGDTAPGEAKQP